MATPSLPIVTFLHPWREGGWPVGEPGRNTPPLRDALDLLGNWMWDDGGYTGFGIAASFQMVVLFEL